MSEQPGTEPSTEPESGPDSEPAPEAPETGSAETRSAETRSPRPSQPTPTRPAPTDAPTDDPLRSSGASRTWISLGALSALLIITVVFVAQNTASVPLKLFGWTWHPPLAAALLAAVALGLSIALIAGSMRILQLRRRVRRNRKSEKRPDR